MTEDYSKTDSSASDSTIPPLILQSECEHVYSSEFSQANFNGCLPYHDSLLCWPPTAPNHMAMLPCLNDLNGITYDPSANATRYCQPNGTWENHTNYEHCTEMNPCHIMDAEQTELQANFYLSGYLLSLISLSLALFIFIRFKELHCLRNKIHANLFLTYILPAVLWILVLMIETYNWYSVDHVGSVLLHYFLLTNYFWMLVEGLYLYTLVVKTFSGTNLKFRVYVFIGWGCPAIIITIWLILKQFETNDQGRASPKCDSLLGPWFQYTYSDLLVYASSILGGLFVNLIFLVRIMWVLIVKLRTVNYTMEAETRQYKKGMKALLVLIPLLGITYLLILYGPQSAIFAYLQAILISIQGFVVALLYCFLNSEVKQAMRHRWDVWRENRIIGNDSHSEQLRHRYAMNRQYSSSRSRTESIRLTSNGSTSP